MVSSLNLLVIRSPELEKSAQFYSALGFAFSKHSHGKGPEHYASEGDITFEIYPELDRTTTATRLGFKVADLEALLPQLVDLGGTILSPIKDSPWGKRAVLQDPTGHKLELIQA